MAISREIQLPLGAETMRAPTAWILGGLFAGLMTAGLVDGWGWAGWFYLLAGFHFGWLALRSEAGAWWLTLAGFWLGAGLAFETRAPKGAVEWTTLPAREAEAAVRLGVVREMEWENGRSWFCVGKVEAIDPDLVEVVGARVWISGRLTNDQARPVEGSLLRMKGILSGLAGAEEGFEQGLFRSGVYFRINRIHILNTVEEADFFRTFLSTVTARVDCSLRAGSEGKEHLADLMTSVMLGWKHRVASEVRDRFRTTGTIHVMAVSGLHVGMVLLVVWRLCLLMRIGQRKSIVLALVVSLLHVLVAGSPPSAVRAFMMALVLSLAPVLKRRYDPVSAIAVSALLVAVIFPQQLRTIGFQLSYLVVTGIVLYAMPILQWFKRAGVERLKERRPAGAIPQSWMLRGALSFGFWFGGLFMVGLASFIVSLPLTVGSFQTLPWAALWINPLIVPLATLVMLHGVLSIGFGMAGLLEVSGFLNHGAWLALTWMDGLVGWAARSGFNELGLEVQAGQWGVGFSILVILTMIILPPVKGGKLRVVAIIPPLLSFGLVTILKNWN
ncbi:MAG: ComEC/Rec2 family competence protein [Puniceicoccaceae bacterium]